MSRVFCTASGVINYNGSPLQLKVDECWAADDPLVLARPDLFAADPTVVRRTTPAGVVVEQATKAPGERRTVKRGG